MAHTMTGAENQRSAMCKLVGHSVWVCKPENRWADGWNHVQAPELRRDVPAQAGRSEADGHVLPSSTFCAVQVPVDGVMPVHMWVPSTDSHIDLGQKHPHRYTHDHVQPRHPVASQADTQNEPSLVTKRTSLSVHLRLCHGAVRDAGEMTNVLVWLHFNYVFQLLMCLLSPSGCQFLGHNNANNSSNSCYLVIA